MKPAVIISLLCLGLGGCQRPLRVPTSPSGPSLRVLTYNVNFGLAGDPATLAAIDEARADLILLQETTPEWEPHLRRALRAYPHVAFKHSGGAGGLAVFSRFPFREQATLLSPEGWFPAWQLSVGSPLGPLQLLVVHLRPPISDGGSWVSGYFTTRDFRHNEVVRVSGRLDLEQPTLIVGDFNEGERGKAVRYLRQRGLRSVLGEFHPGATTWRWQTSLGKLRLQLDHIFYSAHLRPCDARVLPAGRSDHLPLLAVFQR